MPRFVELRRHTDNDGDVLTGEGVAAALRIGAGLAGGYRLGVSTGAQRATQTLACFLAALAQPVPGGVIVEPGLRSERSPGSTITPPGTGWPSTASKQASVWVARCAPLETPSR